MVKVRISYSTTAELEHLCDILGVSARSVRISTKRKYRLAYLEMDIPAEKETVNIVNYNEKKFNGASQAKRDNEGR